MKAKERNIISKAINSFMSSISNSGWFKDIPINEIDTILKLYGYRLVNEDLTDLECFLCGREGNAIFQIAPINIDEFCKYGLSMSWYKSDGKKQYPYDVVTYLT